MSKRSRKAEAPTPPADGIFNQRWLLCELVILLVAASALFYWTRDPNPYHYTPEE